MSDLPTVAELAASKPHLTSIISVTDGNGDERVIYALQPKQLEAFNLTPMARKKGEKGPIYIGFGGAAGGGKSFLARVLATAVAFFWPGSSSLIYRETEGDVKKNHVGPFQMEVPQYFEGRKLWSYNGSEMCMTWFNASKTYFGYLKQDEDVKRAQGPAFDAFFFEESTFYTWFMVQWLTGNRLRSSVDGTTPFAFYPSNPGGRGMHWYKRLFIQRRYREGERAEDYAFVQSLLADNIELDIRDPSYKRKLDHLPEPHRSWQRDGNFAAGAGSALSQIDWKRHLVDPFDPPDHWLQFGSYDWGYRHPFSFGHYALSPDDALFKMETVTGVRLLPPQQIERIKSVVPVDALDYIVAGHDVKHKIKARGVEGPSIMEQFEDEDILLSLADIDRKQGLQQLRKMLEWTNTGPIVDGRPTAGDPQLRFFDTKNNRACLEQMENAAEDPHDAEDILKVNADDFGEGGDDMLEETRYAVMSCPVTPNAPSDDAPFDAWSREALRSEMGRSRKSKTIGSGRGSMPDAVT
ncbi:hypothetical protein LCGC14_2022950 [marine sediment metagenome]|uniref:Phage terminase large subunit N-terminal domain-containing protein n=1 Tax=marine sediment metagenome TaxID=412755 RepID=A0A0F9FJF2_9ZZZZ